MKRDLKSDQWKEASSESPPQVKRSRRKTYLLRNHDCRGKTDIKSKSSQICGYHGSDASVATEVASAVATAVAAAIATANAPAIAKGFKEKKADVRNVNVPNAGNRLQSLRNRQRTNRK